MYKCMDWWIIGVDGRASLGRMRSCGCQRRRRERRCSAQGSLNLCTHLNKISLGRQDREEHGGVSYPMSRGSRCWMAFRRSSSVQAAVRACPPKSNCPPAVGEDDDEEVEEESSDLSPPRCYIILIVCCMYIYWVG